MTISFPVSAAGASVRDPLQTLLLVYVAHLLLIYGDFGTFNARRAVDRSFGIVEALLSTLVLLVVMTGLAFLWSRLKARSPNLRKGVSIGFALLLLGIFLFGPGQ